MDTETTTQRIKTLLARRFELGRTVDEIGDHEPLFEDGLGLDSAAAIELVGAIEEDLGVCFEDDDLRIENFGSPAALSAFITRRFGV